MKKRNAGEDPPRIKVDASVTAIPVFVTSKQKYLHFMRAKWPKS